MSKEPEKLNKIVMLRLDADMHQKLKAVAKRRDRHMTYIIREMLAKALGAKS